MLSYNILYMLLCCRAKSAGYHQLQDSPHADCLLHRLQQQRHHRHHSGLHLPAAPPPQVHRCKTQPMMEAVPLRKAHLPLDRAKKLGCVCHVDLPDGPFNIAQVGNQLTGTLPPLIYIGNRSNPDLQIFDASRNQLSGSLPLDYLAGKTPLLKHHVFLDHIPLKICLRPIIQIEAYSPAVQIFPVLW